MHPTRMRILFYSVTGIAAAFLSWVSQTLLGETKYLAGIDPGYSLTKINIGDGWFTLACFLIIILITITGKRNAAVSHKKVWWVALFAFISLLIGLYNLLTILSTSKAHTGDSLVMKVSPGVGLYLTIIVSVLLIIVPFRYKAVPDTTSTKVVT